nr:hypothetical protein [Pseudomonas sp. A46]
MNNLSGLLKKPIEELNKDELVVLRREAEKELGRRAFNGLEQVVAQYVQLYGSKEGVERIGEDLCKRIAPGKYPEGWSGLVNYLVKIS